MTAPPPDLKEFRIEFPGNGLAHIVFDAPGRTMNVFSEAAIVEIGLIARWLEEADIRGALIRSGKATGFCAGANLPEIWAAYDTIMATPTPRRFRAAYDHFFRLSLALRALETCGKPVAAAIAGLALGGGGELALASHYPRSVCRNRSSACFPAREARSGCPVSSGSSAQCRSFCKASASLASARSKPESLTKSSKRVRMSLRPRPGFSHPPSRSSLGTARIGRRPRPRM
jgi:3-hydroxyacyl-CoA dehydrogenase/enoyl-CoA hydratase/3-hydroxybutyryl-CoA epimerase